MNISDMPHSEYLGEAKNVPELAELLSKAIGYSGNLFRYMDRILGGTRTGRLLFQELIPQYDEAVPLPRPSDAEDTARQLFSKSFMSEVRYDPPHHPVSTMKKGWEVHIARIKGKLIVIVLAAWV